VLDVYGKILLKVWIKKSLRTEGEAISL